MGCSQSRVREETYNLPTRQGCEAFKEGWGDAPLSFCFVPLFGAMCELGDFKSPTPVLFSSLSSESPVHPLARFCTAHPVVGGSATSFTLGMQLYSIQWRYRLHMVWMLLHNGLRTM